MAHNPRSLNIPSTDLQVGDLIGGGGFSDVYCGTWIPHQHKVAIKKIKITHLEEQVQEDFQREISIMCEIRFDHLLNIYGACMEPGVMYALIVEYMSLGSLFEVLRKQERNEIKLQWPDHLSIALQMIKGVNYLHKLPQPIIHRDIKSLNVLMTRIGQDFLVKIGDFGLSKIYDEASRQSSEGPICGTLHWKAPELLIGKIHTKASDVFALGIVLWELETGSIPYQDMDPVAISIFVINENRLPISSPNLNITRSFKEAIKRAWAQEPDQRPTCEDLLNLLNPEEIIDHLSKKYIDIATCISTENSIHLQILIIETFDSNDKELFSSWFNLLHAYNSDPDGKLDESFNTIIDEPLSPLKLLEVLSKRQSLTPYIVDSLKRCHALNDIHAIFPQCVRLKNQFNNGDIFMNLIGKITTRTLLTIAIETMSNEGQRFLGNFIKKNDLPIPLSYYIWSQPRSIPLYKINFNGLVETLCMTDDRLFVQLGSKSCASLGKTSLLPFIFNNKRKESLFTDSRDRNFRNSCIDVLFGAISHQSYTIMDLHGTIEETRNLSLVKAIQLYASLQIIYVTEADLPSTIDNAGDFIHSVMHYSSEIAAKPTIIVIFDPNFDQEDKTQQLINRFKHFYSEKKWPHVYWTTVPLFNEARDLDTFTMSCRAERLKPTFANILKEVEPYIKQQPLFRSCFAIQSTYLINRISGTRPITRHDVQFDVESKLTQLFHNLTDKTENLKIVTPISYYRSQIDTVRKQLSLETADANLLSNTLLSKLTQLEADRKQVIALNAYTKFIIDLINNRTYTELLITEIYLGKWRSKYVPNLKREIDAIKQKIYEHERKVSKSEESMKTLKKQNANLQRIQSELDEQRQQSNQLKQKLYDMEFRLSNVDLTFGLFCDELFALYDFLYTDKPAILDECKHDFDRLPQNLSHLVYKGFAIHILRSRPLFCESRLVKMCLKRLKTNGPLAVLTVIGEQSSAKSSLLNSIFGCNFRVSTGRCTIGMYLGIAYHKDYTIVILDSEGLLSLEESGSIFDNQMITMAVLTSHLVLINHKGELSSSLESLIGMSLYAKLQIQSSPFKPTLLFVLRDQIDRERKVFLDQLYKFKDNLQASSSFLEVSIDDELEIREQNIALLPSAFSEDVNPNLNITQRWRNQTFPIEINNLRATIFTGLEQQIISQKHGYKGFDYFYNKAANSWKSIDDLGQGLLECKTLYELSVTNELKAIAKKIIIEKSQLLQSEGTKLLDGLLEKQKHVSQEILNNNQLNADIYMKQFIENGIQQLKNMASGLISQAIDEYEQETQQKYYADMKGKIKKNIEPSIECMQQLLQQRFEQNAYIAARESAVSYVQKQLLNSAKKFFDEITRESTDIDKLNEALNNKHHELVQEFKNSLKSLRKSYDDITNTILNIYNSLVNSRRGTADRHDIYNRCPIYDLNRYQTLCHELDNVFRYIESYLLSPVAQKQNPLHFISGSGNSANSDAWKELRDCLCWFVDHRDERRNKRIFFEIVQRLIPQLNHNVIGMLSTVKLSYSDPQTIDGLIQHVNNSMIGQTSCIQQNYTHLNLPQITADLVLISLRLLINEAVEIADRKHEELKLALRELDTWKKNISHQFLVIRDSYEQGTKFRMDLEKQFIEETIRIYKTKAIYQINLKITDNPQIDPDKIARNAYDESFGSIPPDSENILKYVLDINRYYLELALDKVSISKENIISAEIQNLQKVISDCVNGAVETVKQHACHNVHAVYQSIVTRLCSIVPGFELSPIIGISAEIKNPDQFKQSFQQLIQSIERMQEEIKSHESEFNDEAIKSCRSLITQRLGCQACCPGCGAKCSNTDPVHQHHKSSYHITMAFKGWRWTLNNQPCLEQCYQKWLTGTVEVGSEMFNPRRKYYAERVQEWLDDLEEKSKTGYLCNESIPPPDQRRAWMAVRTALISHYKIVDQPSYDKQLYPSTIQSLPAGYTLNWK